MNTTTKSTNRRAPIARSVLALALAAVAFTAAGCGTEVAGQKTSSHPLTTKQPGAADQVRLGKPVDALIWYVEHGHPRATRQAVPFVLRHSPCFMHPGRWNAHIENGYPVCDPRL